MRSRSGSPTSHGRAWSSWSVTERPAAAATITESRSRPCGPPLPSSRARRAPRLTHPRMPPGCSGSRRRRWGAATGRPCTSAGCPAPSPGSLGRRTVPGRALPSGVGVTVLRRAYMDLSRSGPWHCEVQAPGHPRARADQAQPRPSARVPWLQSHARTRRLTPPPSDQAQPLPGSAGSCRLPTYGKFRIRQQPRKPRAQEVPARGAERRRVAARAGIYEGLSAAGSPGRGGGLSSRRCGPTASGPL